MTAENRSLMDLPYEVYAKIHEYLQLQDIRALSRANKHMFTTYKNINATYTDKISYHSTHDSFEAYERHEKLKQITADLLDINATFEQCVKFCLRNDEVERIEIKCIANETYNPGAIPYAYLTKLTHLNISAIVQSNYSYDYILPILDCTNTLQSLIYENGTLSNESMNQLRRNENLKNIKLQNVNINNIHAFHKLLSHMKNIEKLEYYNFSFSRLLPETQILNAIFDNVDNLSKLKHVKITAWQKHDHETTWETREYNPSVYNFKLRPKNAASFFSALLPLLTVQTLARFELYYDDRTNPNSAKGLAVLRYTLVDTNAETLKTFVYHHE